MNTNIATTGPQVLFQPDDDFAPPNSVGYAEMQANLAFLVGLVAFGLPLVLMFSPYLGESCFRDSISHFYYSPRFGTFFVGCLFFIGGFLIAYRGENPKESQGAGFAGLGAILVALFPTEGDGCDGVADYTARVFADVNEASARIVTPWAGDGAFAMLEGAELWHGIGAGIVFGYLGLFCLIVMRRIAPRHRDANGDVIPTKLRRNALYFVCGVTIILCVLSLGVKALTLKGGALDTWNEADLTFVVETVALWAFGSAWFVKSRLIPYFNDPGELVTSRFRLLAAS